MTRRDPFKYHQQRIDRQNRNMPDPIRTVLEPGYEPSVKPEARSSQQPDDPEQSAEKRDLAEFGDLRVRSGNPNEGAEHGDEQRPDDNDHQKIVAPTDEERNVTIRHDSELLQRLREALIVTKDVIARLESEDVQVVALQLNDVTDDLNDALLAVEREFSEKDIRPGWVALDSFAIQALAWDGRHLVIYDNTGRSSPVLSRTRDTRARVAEFIEALYDECSRKR